MLVKLGDIMSKINTMNVLHDWIVKPFLNFVMKLWYNFYFAIIRAMAWIIDMLTQLFFIFAGMTPINSPNGVNAEGEDAGIDIVNYFLTQKSFQKAYLYLCLVALGLIIIFTIAKIIKQDYFERSGPRSKAPIFRSVALSFIAFICVIPVFYFMIDAVGALAMLVMKALGYRGGGIGSMLFDMCWSDGGNAIKTVANSLGSGSMLNDFQYEGNLKASGQQDPNNFGWYSSDTFYVFYWNSIKGEARGYSDVEFYWYTFFIAGVAIVINLFKMMIAMITRLYKLIALFIVAPSPISQIVLDDGQKFKQWKDLVLQEAVKVVGCVMVMMVFMLIATTVENIDLMKFAFTDKAATASNLLETNSLTSELSYDVEMLYYGGADKAGDIDKAINSLGRAMILIAGVGAIQDMDSIITPLLAGGKSSMDLGAGGQGVLNTAKGVGKDALGFATKITGAVAGAVSAGVKNRKLKREEAKDEANKLKEEADKANTPQTNNPTNPNDGGNNQNQNENNGGNDNAQNPTNGGENENSGGNEDATTPENENNGGEGKDENDNAQSPEEQNGNNGGEGKEKEKEKEGTETPKDNKNKEGKKEETNEGGPKKGKMGKSSKATNPKGKKVKPVTKNTKKMAKKMVRKAGRGAFVKGMAKHMFTSKNGLLRTGLKSSIGFGLKTAGRMFGLGGAVDEIAGAVNDNIMKPLSDQRENYKEKMDKIKENRNKNKRDEKWGEKFAAAAAKDRAATEKKQRKKDDEVDPDELLEQAGGGNGNSNQQTTPVTTPTNPPVNQNSSRNEEQTPVETPTEQSQQTSTENQSESADTSFEYDVGDNSGNDLYNQYTPADENEGEPVATGTPVEQGSTPTEKTPGTSSPEQGKAQASGGNKEKTVATSGKEKAAGGTKKSSGRSTQKASNPFRTMKERSQAKKLERAALRDSANGVNSAINSMNDNQGRPTSMTEFAENALGHAKNLKDEAEAINKIYNTKTGGKKENKKLVAHDKSKVAENRSELSKAQSNLNTASKEVAAAQQNQNAVNAVSTTREQERSQLEANITAFNSMESANDKKNSAISREFAAYATGTGGTMLEQEAGRRGVMQIASELGENNNYSDIDIDQCDKAYRYLSGDNSAECQQAYESMASRVKETKAYKTIGNAAYAGQKHGVGGKNGAIARANFGEWGEKGRKYESGMKQRAENRQNSANSNLQTAQNNHTQAQQNYNDNYSTMDRFVEARDNYAEAKKNFEEATRVGSSNGKSLDTCREELVTAGNNLAAASSSVGREMVKTHKATKRAEAGIKVRNMAANCVNTAFVNPYNAVKGKINATANNIRTARAEKQSARNQATRSSAASMLRERHEEKRQQAEQNAARERAAAQAAQARQTSINDGHTAYNDVRNDASRIISEMEANGASVSELAEARRAFDNIDSLEKGNTADEHGNYKTEVGTSSTANMQKLVTKLNKQNTGLAKQKQKRDAQAAQAQAQARKIQEAKRSMGIGGHQKSYGYVPEQEVEVQLNVNEETPSQSQTNATRSVQPKAGVTPRETPVTNTQSAVETPSDVNPQVQLNVEVNRTGANSSASKTNTAQTVSYIPTRINNVYSGNVNMAEAKPQVVKATIDVAVKNKAIDTNLAAACKTTSFYTGAELDSTKFIQSVKKIDSSDLNFTDNQFEDALRNVNTVPDIGKGGQKSFDSVGSYKDHLRGEYNSSKQQYEQAIKQAQESISQYNHGTGDVSSLKRAEQAIAQAAQHRLKMNSIKVKVEKDNK